MEVRVNLQHSQLSFESAKSAEELKQLVIEAIENDSKTLIFEDKDGQTFIIDRSNLASVTIGAEKQRKVGFIN
ncbi:DUF3107 domain-containing protein [Leucobacter sp. OH1287]|uniref:DUF3107 domain-containing protein n=1 Tax=Leucobacter sp. OH1287 TaxID=2491049 RepID=UPI000F5F09A0|nr:DUF3107 domain-containing protein [Leucobacter sp. OH1287]RRD61818.1 DUF3107 domain-containing protein [Leucobacter sp. OH1287]